MSMSMSGILGGSKLGVEPILKARDMADKNVEHLGVMAYTANFQWLKPRKSPGDRMAVSCDLHTTTVNRPAHFRLEMSREVDPREVTAEVVGPPGTTDCRLSLAGNKGTFTPTHVGMHQLIVYNEGEKVAGSPINIRVTPELSKISFPGMDPCAIGSIVEVLVS
uniref:(California timema) hypothetical protein n=2 Tax=Timema TaxID=61471 RepID=A0A7R9JM25_TIMCA|nr:unnamed protein product [Timema californicum]